MISPTRFVNFCFPNTLEEAGKVLDRDKIIEGITDFLTQASATTLSPLKLEDFFGTPEPILPTLKPEAPQEDRHQGPLLAPRIPLALGNDLGSAESLLDAVRTQTSALTGAQALGVTREVTKAGRREHARQLFVGPVEPVVSLVEKLPQPEVESRSRGRQASRQGATASRQTGRRAPPPRRGEETYFERKEEEEEEELVRRNEVVASVPKRRKEIKLTGQRAMKKKKTYSKHASKRGRVANIHSYRVTNEDGSITWGYENADGSFKEETIGVDCVTHGKYGYIDPNGEVRMIILLKMDLFSSLRKLTKESFDRRPRHPPRPDI